MQKELSVTERLAQDAKTAQCLGRYGAWVHRYFESTQSTHIHNVAEDGSHYLVGNGATILRVIKPSRRNGTGEVWKIEPAKYSDYFLASEMQ